MCGCRVVLREDTRLALSSIDSPISGGVLETSGDCGDAMLEAALTKVFTEVADVVRNHARTARRIFKLKIESLPPRVEDGLLYTGQWVGIVEADIDGDCLEVVIAPKYGSFARVYREVVERSSNYSEALALALSGMHTGGAGLPSVSLALLLIEE